MPQVRTTCYIQATASLLHGRYGRTESGLVLTCRTAQIRQQKANRAAFQTSGTVSPLMLGLPFTRLPSNIHPRRTSMAQRSLALHLCIRPDGVAPTRLPMSSPTPLHHGLIKVNLI